MEVQRQKNKALSVIWRWLKGIKNDQTRGMLEEPMGTTKIFFIFLFFLELGDSAIPKAYLNQVFEMYHKDIS